jgi:leucyl/phenylalanyl-tRNA---protein transferase
MMELTPELLLRAYAVGIFPMAEDAQARELFWFDPEYRGILPIEGFHMPRRLRKVVRHRVFGVSVDGDFEGVIRACAEPAPDRPRTWINEEIVRLYCTLHRMGHAHSVECRRDGRLVGGLYGVSLGGAFFGESMFSRETDASKVALVHLVARLKRNGFALLDSQFVTEHLKQFGAVEIPRTEYRARLARAIRLRADFAAGDQEDLLEAYLQSRTQTS